MAVYRVAPGQIINISMNKKTTTSPDPTFKEEVIKGLSDYPKHLSSKYFYDARGDELFQEIMAMPEYYLTDCETEILENHTGAILEHFVEESKPFNLIELGAGDGKKTKILLKALQDARADFTYRPIDISENVLELLAADLEESFPGMRVEPLQGTYFESLEKLCTLEDTRKVILFLGSNIGNLLHPKAIEFLKSIRILMSEKDLLFIGFDQKKNPQTVLDAYNDKAGITEAFNKNILHRINREFQGDFDPDLFLHWEVYDPETGTAKSYLVAREAHVVTLSGIDKSFRFKKWETIHTEISQKYDDDVVAWLAEKAGLIVVTHFSDSKSYYKNYILKRK